MFKLKTYRHIDQTIFQCEAFSMLIPEGWFVAGGIIWRNHATMPGAIQLSVNSPDGLYELKLHPSIPYYFGNQSFSFFGQQAKQEYMGNEIRRPVSGSLDYIQQSILPNLGFRTRLLTHRKFPELESALHVENPSGFGSQVSIDAGITSLEYAGDGYLFEGDITCGIVVNQMMYGQTSWIADKIISTRAPKGKYTEAYKVFAMMLNSFKFNLRWFNFYHQLVQSYTQLVLQDIKNAGDISRIIHSTSEYISNTVRSTFENQQRTNDRVFKGISESIRGVNSYYDPYRGYSVEIPNQYGYVYANSLGEYIVTDNPNYNPNVGSNLNWTILNRTFSVN